MSAEELREEVQLAGRDHDGETRTVDHDVLGLIIATVDPKGKPDRYLRTGLMDSEDRYVFIHEDHALVDGVDPRLRRRSDI
jgi:hypothetical protein